MAKKTSPSILPVVGPTMLVLGMPRNPSDEIRDNGVPIRAAQDGLGMPGLVERRPFSIPTRNPLHYNDGPGTDEVVTSRRTIPPLQLEPSHTDNSIDYGVDKNKYSQGPNEALTSKGVEIRGT